MSKVSYLFIIGGGIGAYGGYWQTKRRQQKIDYLDFMQKRITAEPVQCPTTLTEAQLEERKMERVFVEGIPEIEYNWGGYVYTPITLKSGHTILMNRGWSTEDDALECPEEEQKGEYYRFHGLLTPLDFVP